MQRTTGLVVLSAWLAVSGIANAQQIKGRVMVILDTSGSMGYYFRDPNPFGFPPNGDYPGGDGSYSYTDRNVNNQFSYPGKRINGTCTQADRSGCEGPKSRLFAAKNALSNAVNAYGGDIDFGLESFQFQLCGFNNPLCEQCAINCTGFGCSYNCLYANNQFTQLARVNWVNSMCGGQIIQLPGVNSGLRILPWVDHIEDHRTSNDGNNAYGTGATPLNPEIRASGGTPLAQALDVALTQWYTPARAADPQVNCRPYAVVLATDGNQSPGCPGNPVTSAQTIYNANPQNRVLVYVIGVAIGGGNQMPLNQIANAGGTGQARFANSQGEIESAFADIASASVKFEICNNADDNCNTFIDEGLGVYQDCTANNQCMSGTCNAGRCTCANNGQCQNGFLCAGGFCKPSCSVGSGQCLRTGVRKCSGQGTACCVNDGQVACTALTPGNPANEICNGIDDNCNGIIDDPPVCQMCSPVAETCDGKDNDCDGVVDNNLVDTNKPCGLNVGICRPGTTACVNGALVCQGGVPPAMETCNNQDDDCDGIVDGMTRNCYGGPNGTDGVGVCRGGQQRCTAGAFGACTGEVRPSGEICDGLDNNCDGMVDNVMGAGASCCPSGMCGVGICRAGMMRCSGGSLQCIGAQGPQGEICDGLDNDCNGKVDDLPGLGNACQPQNGCAGMLVCDPMQKMVVCQPSGVLNPEICNAMDDNCNGKIDEEPDVTKNDMRVGQACGNPMNLAPPCMAGKTVCKNGQIVCEGAVGPGMEVCDGKDNDCDGVPDNMAPCPVGFVCFMGECDPLCQQGEFPCPGGYTAQTVNGQCLCVADKNCNPPCGAGLFCDTQTGMCVDKCKGVNCPMGFQCDQGLCVGCEKFGCAMCERCDRGTHLCVKDKCCNVSCMDNQFCDPSDGACKGTCPMGCPVGDICDNGACVKDLCKDVRCPQGEACSPKTGMCEPNACYNASCAPNLQCCGGKCVTDPCAPVTCPANTTCAFSPLTCQVSCQPVKAEDRDEIVGAGGGGFACSSGGRSSPRGGALARLARSLLGAARGRSRRRPAGRGEVR